MQASTTARDASVADPSRTSTVLYRREAGKQLVYQIKADGYGNYEITLEGKVLKRGSDALVARGLRAPGPRVRESAINYARVAVLYLHGMREE